MRVTRALTIQQPYAELLLPRQAGVRGSGPKRAENRTWFTRELGLIAIHAGKGNGWMKRLAPWELRQLARSAGSGEAFDALDYGAIVGVGLVDACVRYSPGVALSSLAPQHRWLRGHEHATGPYCWTFAWTLRLPEPMPCRGYQQIWAIPDDVQDQLTDQLRSASMRAGVSPSSDGAGLFDSISTRQLEPAVA